MDDVGEVFLQNIFDLSCSEKEIVDYIHSIDIKDESIEKAYSSSIQRKMPVVATFLLKEGVVNKKFDFMKETLSLFLKKDRILSLPFLYTPLEDKTYDQILEVIFGDGQLKRYQKRVGIAFKRYGTKLLNNMYILSFLFDMHKYIDEILVLDHRQAIGEDILTSLEQGQVNLDWLVRNYKLTRVFKILVTYKSVIFRDSIRMIDMIKLVKGDDFKKEMKECIGRKPRSFHEIHSKLLHKFNEIKNNQLQEIPLKQDIERLDGEELYEYTISVPRIGQDLIDTGLVMQHCVGSYIMSVVKKNCQILNLQYENELAYTVEIIPSSSGYRIRQFKGYRNSMEYEGREGEKYRNSLVEKLNSKI